MKHLKFLSADEKTAVHMVYWLPKNPPVATIQLVHGMAEYSERYDDFARYLARQGFAVIGHDHLGHGQSVDNQTIPYGYFTKRRPDEVFISDIKQVSDWVADTFKSIPHIILGHSMGSFAVRNYLQQLGTSSKLAGVILMGTGKKPHGLEVARVVSAITNRVTPKKVNRLLNKLAFGGYARHFEEAGQFNWLSQNQSNVKQYEENQLTGFTFTNNGFYTLFKLVALATRNRWAYQVDTNLAYLVISGAEDPVGQYSKGPKKVANELKEAGASSVELRLFEHLRHEILFEQEKEQVYTAITTWIQKNILHK